MAEDWAVDVRKYVPDADSAAIAGIVRHCGIALRNRDSSLVSFSDPAETDRVREGFLRKKLALTEPDSVLDAAIAKVGDIMRADTTKNRVTVYYLLAAAFGKLGLFGSASANADADPEAPIPLMATPAAPEPVMVPPPAVTAAPAAAAAATAAATGATARAAPVPAAVPHAAAAAPAAPPHSDTRDSHDDRPGGGGGGFGWLLPLVLLVLIGAGILYMIFGRNPAPFPASAPAPTASVEAPAGPIAAQQLPAMIDIPEGAGLVQQEVDSKPFVSVYFDTAKTDVTGDIVPAAVTVKAYLDSHPGTSLAISGYNDPRGDAKMNAELSKKRAFAVRDALVAQGVAATAIALVKPADTTGDTAAETDGLAEARRVDVTVRDGPVPASEVEPVTQ